MKNKKIVLYFLAFCMLIFTAYKVANTYAIFYTEKTGEVELPIAKWNISLNETEVTSGTTQQVVIDRFAVIPSEYTAENKIAPGMQGYFEIEINPQDTQVSIIYDITIDDAALEGNQIKLLSIEESKNNITLIKTDKNTYTGVILLENIVEEYSHIVRLDFSWENNEENNEEDTEIGTNISPEISIPIKFSARQYLGETIEEYVESTENSTEEDTEEEGNI